MGERKVVNKYFPPDFDPAFLPRRRQPKNRQMNVRNMLAMSIRCGTCGCYMYKGTKFNSRKEDGDSYLGIQIVRFYFKCSNCSAEITYVTDPQNLDYAVESGASRNFEPWRAVAVAEEEDRKKRKAGEMGDAMKSLENTTADSKRAMDNLAALDELKSFNSRRAAVTAHAMLEALHHKKSKMEQEEEEEEEDAAYARAVYQNNTRKRIDDDDQDFEFHSVVGTSSRPWKRRTKYSANKTEFSISITKKKKKKSAAPANKTETETETEEDAQDAINVLQLQYGD